MSLAVAIPLLIVLVVLLRRERRRPVADLREHVVEKSNVIELRDIARPLPMAMRDAERRRRR